MLEAKRARPSMRDAEHGLEQPEPSKRANRTAVQAVPAALDSTRRIVCTRLEQRGPKPRRCKRARARRTRDTSTDHDGIRRRRGVVRTTLPAEVVAVRRAIHARSIPWHAAGDARVCPDSCELCVQKRGALGSARNAFDALTRGGVYRRDSSPTIERLPGRSEHFD